MHPLSIDNVEDGGTYTLPAVSLVETNLFLRVGCVHQLFIKVPSQRGLHDYRVFIKSGMESAEDLRSLEEAERWERLDQTLESFPSLKPILRVGTEATHYLAIHRLQYERLRSQTAVRIPRAKFGVVRSTRAGIFRKLEPGLFQEKVAGTTLWDMFDFTATQIHPRWRGSLPGISDALSRLLDSPLRIHLDWNLKNFIYDEVQGRLTYVDLKPTIFVARSGNEQNLKGIRDYFIV
jgi:hypothetical protein